MFRKMLMYLIGWFHQQQLLGCLRHKQSKTNSLRKRDTNSFSNLSFLKRWRRSNNSILKHTVKCYKDFAITSKPTTLKGGLLLDWKNNCLDCLASWVAFFCIKTLKQTDFSQALLFIHAPFLCVAHKNRPKRDNAPKLFTRPLTLYSWQNKTFFSYIQL